METVNRYLFEALRRYAGRVMQVHGDRQWTYAEAARAIHGVAQDLQRRGLEPGDRVALIAENSPRWFHAYAGIVAAGGVVVPRGVDISERELAYILEHAGCRLAFSDRPETAASVETIPLQGHDFPPPAEVTDTILDGYARRSRPEDLVMVLYTSGTTGRAKGVMLEQRNIAHNLRVLPPIVQMEEGDLWVSVLPSWHTFELTVELCGYSIGCVTVYSDKRHLRADLREHRPHLFASVPRIWQSIHAGAMHELAKRGGLTRWLFACACAGTRMCRRGNPLGWPLHLLGRRLFYSKMLAVTGGRLKYAVSGGGYLPPHVDEFFDALGIKLLVGYGLTETAPVVALRSPRRNVLGTIGRPLPETEIRIGKKGTFEVRGPQVMRGYYRDEALTREVLDEQGWFDTGDLGRITSEGDLVFVGRLKETIVLSGGENIEPEPIELVLLDSPLIQQVMLVGQDRKALGALVVPEANRGASHEKILEEVRTRSASFRSFERVHRVVLADEAFTPENGLLTATLKMRRNVIAERYAERIDSLYE